ncbi:MAG: cytochrome c oxidase assembly protein [Chloroflexi bacterium]|nr:cytochrome c oxidase assembly protein [Chloroflexota bacterium]
MEIDFSLVSFVSLLILAACQPRPAALPASIAQDYIRAVWARDYVAVYQLLSAEDRAAQPEKDYVAQHDPFAGGTLALAQHAARSIEFSNIVVGENGDRATVVLHVRVPDGNGPELSRILNAETDEASLNAGQIGDLTRQLDDLRAAGKIDFLEGDQTVELRQRDGKWAVFLNLAQAARVTVEGGVKAGLHWEFAPLVGEVRLFPGESARIQYRARNLADRAITAKAEEGTSPAQYANALFFAQCFCLFQETLQPGQEETLAAVIRLDQDLPAGTTLNVRYDFYPIEAFPAGADTNSPSAAGTTAP